MPLPKPSKSKTISRRIKKPNPPLLFTAASHPEPQLPLSKPNKPPRERRVRVICTDPDATDSSSDDEDVPAPVRPRCTHKRFICEISLPASTHTSFNENQREEASASSSSTCLDSENRKGFKISRTEVGLQALCERIDEPVISPSADNQSECLSTENLSASPPGDGPSAVLSVDSLCEGLPADNQSASPLADKPNAGLSADNLSTGQPLVQLSKGLPAETPSLSLSAETPSVSLSEDVPSMGLLIDTLSTGTLADNPSECSAAEEFERFLTQFISVQDESSIPTWDSEMDLLDDSIFDLSLDFDYDFESATWINSAQKV